MTAPQCQKACANVVNDLNSCSSIDCLCTNSNGKQLEQCVDCLVKVGNSASATSNGQETLDGKRLSFIQTPIDTILMSHAQPLPLDATLLGCPLTI